MAGHVRFTALLDANVLYPLAVCDALIEVAVTGIYAAKWTTRIDNEWIRNLAINRGIAPERLWVRRDAMHDACPDWEVPEDAWRCIEPGLTLPDPEDRHVLAAAIAGHADCIVTQNIKHFPKELLVPFGIASLHPDEFLYQQLHLAPFQVLPAFKAMRSRLRNPAFTPAAFADSLERNGLVETAGFLRQALQLI